MESNISQAFKLTATGLERVTVLLSVLCRVCMDNGMPLTHDEVGDESRTVVHAQHLQSARLSAATYNAGCGASPRHCHGP